MNNLQHSIQLNLRLVILLVFSIPLFNLSQRQIHQTFQPNFGNLPLAFIPELGNLTAEVGYQVKSLGGTLLFKSNGVELRLHDSMMTVQFEHANPDVKLRSQDVLPGKVNYLIGNDSKAWRTDVPTYQGIIYEELYPGIDLHYDGTTGLLKGTFVVSPNQDASTIRWRYTGVQSVDIAASGDLNITLTNGNILAEQAPIAWQDKEGQRIIIPVQYLISDEGDIGFDLESYDNRYPLIIDPVIQYSTYVGSSNEVIGWNITVDSDNNIYLVGHSLSEGYPTLNAYQASHAGLFCGRGGSVTPCGDIVISKLNAAGDTLLYSTYLGGTGYDVGLDIALDASRNIYITGTTSSFNFPLANALQPTYAGEVCSSDSLCTDEAFVTKLNADGNTLVYSTYLGGTLTEQANAITVDADGNAYIAGYTFSVDFPTENALQSTHAGDVDVFVSKLNAQGSDIIFSTYLGGSGFDKANGIAIDATQNVYLTGLTQSTNYPTLATAYQPSYVGGPFTGEAFLTKINTAGSVLLYSSFLGGSDIEIGNGIAVDSVGNAYITGLAHSPNFPTTPGAFDTTYNGIDDAFVAKFDTHLNGASSLVYSTLLGSGGEEQGFDVALDQNGQVYVVGETQSANFPRIAALQNIYGANKDAFVTKLNSAGSALIYSTFLGGNLSDTGRGIAIASNITGISAYVTGNTKSPNFPTRFDSYQTTGAGVFVTRIGPGANLALTNNDSVDPARLGYPFNYTISITNNGPDTANNVVVIDTIPANVDFVSANPTQGSCTRNAGTVTCNIGILPATGPGKTAMITISLIPQLFGSYSNSASASGNEFDVDSNDNQDTEDTTVTIAVVNSADDSNDASCDSAHCSLREAIIAANVNADPNTIIFNIPGGGVQTIQPTTPLPWITQPVIIDGTTQPGYAVGAPVIVINGANAVTSTVSPNPPIDLVGINIVGASNSTVRGLVLNDWNYGGVGILNGNNNVIEGNFIGTNAVGTTAVPNLYGVIIYNGSNNRVGGTTSAQRNIISGNNDDGVNIGGQTSAQAVANLVQGNYIGTNAAGTAALGNGDDGVKVEIADGTIIGGTAAGAGNVIAASNNNGVILKGVGSINSLVQGNYIGTDVTGTVAIGNDLAGVRIEDALNNTVGGVVVAARNVISGNQYGVFILNATATGNTVQGNYIGTNAAGTAALAPLAAQSAGVSLSAPNNILGGTTAGARNIISGNVVGVGITSSGNMVQGNYIGTDFTGTQDVGNTAWGIEMVGSPANNVIGGTLPGAGNLIAYNDSNGIVLHGATVGTGNAIQGNSIFSNAGLGIDLSSSPVVGGVTANDAGDTDTGPNNLQNYPVLESTTPIVTGVSIEGNLNSQPNQTYRLEFFLNTICDPWGNGEGQTYMGFRNITTGAGGDVSFTTNFPVTVANGQFITATATDPNGNTSEFSVCLPVIIIPPPSGPVAAPERNYYTTSSVNLSWKGVSWATGYEIEVDTDDDFVFPYIHSNRSLAASAQSDTPPLLDDGVYYWRVGAKKAVGEIVWSAVQSFTVAVP